MASRLVPEDAHDDEEETVLTKETFREQMKLLLGADEARDKVRVQRAALRKKATAAGIELKKFDMIMKMLDWEPAEIREFLYDLITYMDFAEIIGQREKAAQTEMFPAKDPTVQSAEDWEMRGFLATVKPGTKDFGKPPPECPAENHQNYMDGVHRGTAFNGSKFKVVK